jgi:hypothetical protein
MHVEHDMQVPSNLADHQRTKRARLRTGTRKNDRDKRERRDEAPEDSYPAQEAHDAMGLRAMQSRIDSQVRNVGQKWAGVIWILTPVHARRQCGRAQSQ